MRPARFCAWYAAAAIALLLGAVFAAGLEIHVRAGYCHETWMTEASELRTLAWFMIPFFFLVLLYALSFITAFSPRFTAAVSGMLAIAVIWGSVSAANDWAGGLECYRESDPSGEFLQLLALLAARLWCAVEFSNFILSIGASGAPNSRS
jgi:hypothetical protein